MNAINFSINLRKLREDKGISKAELARRVGVSDVTVGYWETGKTEPRMGKVEMVADVLGVTVDELLFDVKPVSNNKEDTSPIKNEKYQVPLYGAIAAGLPLEMIKVEELIDIPEYILAQHPDSFLLRVNGDSMNRIIPNGAYALIDPAAEVLNGDVAAVAVNGYDATLKRFYKLQNTLVLEPDSFNSEHSPQTFVSSNEDCTVKVIGKMVWYMSPYNIKF
ncbi:S24 family peptidase [Paenibacillus sp. GbtcB18]|uniref:helix-turn-helix domain-containing protein n=1 Tax=Paenibacillus sp. GbtcB18 TaxID=2824763 RepID=UPI002815639E|nr:S24 family peptidase [Paenibacillus sp. GbtcB18]